MFIVLMIWRMKLSSEFLCKKLLRIIYNMSLLLRRTYMQYQKAHSDGRKNCIPDSQKRRGFAC